MPGLEDAEAIPFAHGHHGNGPSPNSYEAIRMKDALFVHYSDGEMEYYDLKSDPHEMDNTAGALPPARVRALRDRVSAIKNCRGADDCWRAQHD